MATRRRSRAGGAHRRGRGAGEGPGAEAPDSAAEHVHGPRGAGADREAVRGLGPRAGQQELGAARVPQLRGQAHTGMHEGVGSVAAGGALSEQRVFERW